MREGSLDISVKYSKGGILMSLTRTFIVSFGFIVLSFLPVIRPEKRLTM